MTAATAAPPATQASAPATPAGTEAAPPGVPEGRGWGVALDVLGVIAGLVVVFVVADIWSGGKLSAPFRRGREMPDEDAS